MWLYIAMAGFGSLAVVSILDKFIVSEQNVSPIRYTFYTTAPLILILFGAFYKITLPTGLLAWGVIVLTGVAYLFALWAMYKGYSESEVSRLGPLIGAAIPFFVFGLTRLFLYEALTLRQEAAIVLLVIGSLIISVKTFGGQKSWTKGAGWGILAGFLFAVFQVGSKYTYSQIGFYSGLVWLWGVVGIAGLFLLLSGSLRAQLKMAPANDGTSKKKNAFAIILTDKILGIFAIMLIQYSVSLGSVSVINALSGMQYGLLVVLVAILSKFFPNLFKENYQRFELLQEGIAVAVIAIGVALLLV